MQKRIHLYIIMILLTGILSGCGNKQGETTVEAQGFTIPSAILETKENMGDDVLYYIPNENIESGFMQNLSSFHGDFLVYGFSSEMTENNPENMRFHVKLISPETGEVVADASFNDIDFPNIQACDDTLVITDWGTGEVILLDEKLQEITTYQVECEYNSMYVSPDAEKLYVFLPEQGMQITELSSGEMEVILDNTVNLYVSKKCENVVTFSYTDRKTQLDQYGAIDLETGEVMELPFEGAFSDINYVNDTWIVNHSDNMDRYCIGNDDEIKTFEYKDSSSFLEVHPKTGNFLSKQYDENGFLAMTMYSMEGEFISKCENSLKGAEIQNELVWSEADSGFFFLMLDSAEKDRLMFWDVSTEVSGTDLSLQKIPEEVLPEDAVSKELYSKAKAIGYKHGIEIRIADQMDEDYIDYRVEEMLDEDQLNAALDLLGRELSIYPEGFFDQLLHGSVREIEIHLAGALTNLEIPEEDVNGFTSYSGFAQTREGKAVIVLDVNEGQNLGNFLHHELFHLVDNKLSFDAGIRKDALYSEDRWMELNPEGFEYAGNTYVLPDEIYNEDYDVWFIDTYSKTMPREDRARIMEYAMLGDYNMFIAAPHRQAKLKYLNQCIRDAFDTFGWPEKMVWEETLERSY